MDRQSPLSFVIALAALGASQCSNVAGNVGGGPPGCPASAADASAGGDGSGGAAGDDGGGSPCQPPDSDGITGGCYAFDVTVDDTGFTPVILKAQNNAQVTLTLKNTGSKPHDLVIGCVPISYAGCPPQFCFPADANIASVPPGGSASTTFVTPYVEGIYEFRSDLAGDSQLSSDGGVTGLWGQFVVQ
jgi:hypothetical protein